MAYNNTNLLHKIVDIQNITLDYKNKGSSQEWIYIKIIKPTFNVSRSTFYRYLNTAAKAELKKKEKCLNLLEQYNLKTS